MPYITLAAMRILLPISLSALLLGWPSTAVPQSFESAGTRAQGMGGAFVGVADDASAVYWNPGGLAGGAYFSLILDASTAEVIPEQEGGAGRRSGWLLALTTPALGLSYYRLRSAIIAPSSAEMPGVVRLESLVTHHLGATVVQSLADGVAVGATLKLVRGLAASADIPGGDRKDLLEGWDVLARTGNRFDLDIGVMAAGPAGSAGLVVRNITAPSFRTGGGTNLQLGRQVRAGASVLLLQDWRVAADFDLTRSHGPLGDVREFALGTEAQVSRRAAARAGLRLNTTGDRGRTPSASFGGSYAVLGSVFVDAQVTLGSDRAFRGWGVSGRIMF